jgi:hypothetical protein
MKTKYRGRLYAEDLYNQELLELKEKMEKKLPILDALILKIEKDYRKNLH